MSYAYLVLSLCLVWSADDKAPAAAPAIAPPAHSERIQKLLQNPDDLAAVGAYYREAVREIFLLTMDEPDAAVVRVASFESFLDSLQPKTEESQRHLRSQKSGLAEMKQRIETMRTPVAELEAKALAAPDDAVLFRNYLSKQGETIVRTAYSRPNDARKAFEAVKVFCGKIAVATRNEQLQSAANSVTNPLAWSSWGLHQKMIDDGRRLAARKGQEAGPLVVKSWVDSEPVALADLRGKVVLIAWFAVDGDYFDLVFPYLRAWQAKYAERGLTIIGAASNGDGQLWNDARQLLDPGMRRGARRDPSFTPEREQETLRKFAAFHGLKIRLATRESGLEETYGLHDQSGLVLIDQQGKLHTIRPFAHFKQNAQDIDRGLAELLPAAK